MVSSILTPYFVTNAFFRCVIRGSYLSIAIEQLLGGDQTLEKAEKGFPAFCQNPQGIALGLRLIPFKIYLKSQIKSVVYAGFLPAKMMVGGAQFH